MSYCRVFILLSGKTNNMGLMVCQNYRIVMNG